MAVAQSVGYAALFLVLVLAAPCSAEDQAAAVPESIHKWELTMTSPDDSADMQEFLADQAFWSTVDDASHTIDQHAAAAEQHGQSIIEVAPKDVATATYVAEEAQSQEAQAEQMCLKAKHDVRSKQAQSSKAERDAAVASLKKFCKHARHVVTTEVQQDVKGVFSQQHTAKQIVEATKRHTKTTAQDEKALFKKTLGNIKVTGSKADKNAKNEATANALDHMAQKAIVHDKTKANAACKQAHAIAKKAGGKTTKLGRKKLAYAKKFCKKMKKVIKNEKALIHKDVVATADGKEGPGSLAKHMAAHSAAQDVASSKVDADAACKHAFKQAKEVPAENRDVAIRMAKALCKKVKAVVAKEAARGAAIVQPKAIPQVAPADVGAAAASMQRKADAACQRAKDMAAKMMSGPNGKHFAKMAKKVCKQVEGMVKKAVQKMSDDATPEAAVVPEAVSDAHSVIDSIKKTAEEACAHADRVAEAIEATGDATKATMAKDMATKLCAQVRAAVKKDVEKLAHAENIAGAGAMSPDDVVPEHEPEDAAPSDDAPSDDAAAAIKKKADMACNHAKDEAIKIALSGNLKAAKSASLMAAKLCEAVKGVVNAEKEKEAVIEGHKPEAESDDEDDSASDDEEDKSDDEDKEEDTPEETPAVGKVGAMPASVAKELVNEAAKVHRSEKENADNAGKLCEAAKRKIRDNSDNASTEQRKASVEIAVRFCQKTTNEMKKERKADNKALGKIVKMEAKKYGLKAVKMNTKSSATKKAKVVSTTEIAAERKVFEGSIGLKDGQHVSDKTGLKDAKNEALKDALTRKMDTAKANVDAQLHKQSAQIDLACEKAKSATAMEDNSGARMVKLDKALKFCKNAKKVLATEKKSDYAQLDKIAQKVEADNTVDDNGTSGGVKSVVDAQKMSEGKLTDKAAAMCAMMKAKAKALAVSSPVVRNLAMQQATEFCMKTKTLLAKQAAMDKAAKGSEATKDLQLQIQSVDAVLMDLGGAQNLSEPF